VTRATVLVVDDEPLNRELLRRVLFRDYLVLEAPDADSALTHLRETNIDVILCDQIMPGRTGTDLIREVRRQYPRTVALLLTGYEDAPDVAAACREGVVFAVVAKPWGTTQLKEAIARAVTASRNLS
jgi:two-component system response regulator HupR/HoxA